MNPDNEKRCGWVKLSDPLYVEYHDKEWGRELHDERALFELFSLETQSSGLSWLTILKKREGYRRQFENFDLDKVAHYTQEDMDRILQSGEVIKSRPKIETIIHNAKAFLQIKEEFGTIDSYFWEKIGYKSRFNNVVDYKTADTKSQLSDSIAKDLKRRGFKYVGSITVYAFMQACGMINDHENDCKNKNS